MINHYSVNDSPKLKGLKVQGLPYRAPLAFRRWVALRRGAIPACARCASWACGQHWRLHGKCVEKPSRRAVEPGEPVTGFVSLVK